MALSAVDSVDDAIDATKRLLWPFEWGTWLRLAVVMFFVSSGGGLNYIQSASQFAGEYGNSGSDGFATGSGGVALTGAVGSLDPAALFQVGPDPTLSDLGLGIAALLALAFVAVVLVVLFAVVSSVMEFVLVESLIAETVHVRRYFSANVGNGLRLLGFRILLGIAGLFVFGVFFIGALLLTVGAPDPTAGGAIAVLLAIPLFLLFFLVFGTINGFTTVFVVPIMLHQDRGVFSAWSRFWGALSGEWKEYIAYLFFSVVLGIGVSIVSSIVTLVAGLLVAVPFVLIGLGIYAVAGQSVVFPAAIVLGLVYLFVLVVVSLLVQVPLQSFLRYYALFVLGDTDADLDPITDLRAAVRSPGDGPAPSDGPSV